MKFILPILLGLNFVLLFSAPSYGSMSDPNLSSTDDTLDIDVLDDILTKPSDCKDKHNCVEELCKEIQIIPVFFENPFVMGVFDDTKCEIIMGAGFYSNVPGIKDKYKQEELKDLLDELWNGENSTTLDQSLAQCSFLHEIKHATQTHCEPGSFNKTEKEAFLDDSSCFSHHADKFEEGSEESKTLWNSAFDSLAKAHYNECLEVFDLPSIKDCEECAVKHLVGKLGDTPEKERKNIKDTHKLYCPAVKYRYACVEEEEE